MNELEKLQISLTPIDEKMMNSQNDLDKILFDLDREIDSLSPQADNLDYFIAISSGILCGALDILWVDSFDLRRGREFASDKIDEFVIRTAGLLGCKSTDLKSSVVFLEKKFPIPSDGNTSDFGGGRQHHLRDFAHHPTLAGLVFSLLTQFTYKSYGTDVNGSFIIVDVPEKSKDFIGQNVTTKILYGTITWFFHLVSDVAGSSSSAGNSGGTGIPGPILSLAKEVSALPFFRNLDIGDNSLSVFLSKLFNGTLLARHDENGTIIKDSVLKFDLRGEFGVIAELERQELPVITNECIVRIFYFLRRLAIEIRKNHVRSFNDLNSISWGNVRPANNPTIARMLTIATGVFTTIDVGEAVLSHKYWVSVSYAGVGRFAIAIGQDVVWCLKARNVKKIKQMYEEIKRFSYTQVDERIYKRIGCDMMDVDKLGLTVDQTEILYNLEYYKTLDDIHHTKTSFNNDRIKQLKQEWLEEWKTIMTKSFSSFIQVKGAELHWYTEQELIERVEQNAPEGTWFRLVLLEAMLFEPYYMLSLEKDKKGNDIPSKKYSNLKNPIWGYKKNDGDQYLDTLFTGSYYTKGYIKRLRKCYDRVRLELSEVLKTTIKAVSVGAAIVIAGIATSGALAPKIAVTLVGSNFTGLSGAALTNACLAYLGGGAIAAGGAGMAGGTMTIVGGGAVLSLGVSVGVSGTLETVGLIGKKNMICESAKLLVSVREIFLNDEHDIDFSNRIYEEYVQKIIEIEKGIVELKFQADEATGKEKKKQIAKIKKAEKSVEAMKAARKSMARFVSSFETGME